MSEIQPDRAEMFERLRSTLHEPMETTAETEGNLEKRVSDGVESPPASIMLSTVEYDDRPALIGIALSYPLTLEGRRYEAIELRPPSVWMVRSVTEGTATVDDLFAEMAGVPVAVLQALRWPDAERVTVNARLIAPELVIR